MSATTQTVLEATSREHLRTLWNAFDRALRRRMDVEERLLLRALGPENEDETAARMTEHGRIRALLDLLGGEVVHLAEPDPR